MFPVLLMIFSSDRGSALAEDEAGLIAHVAGPARSSAGSDVGADAGPQDICGANDVALGPSTEFGFPGAARVPVGGRKVT